MTDLLLPSLGADMDRGKLVAWHVAPGDEVRRGQIVAEVETEKATLDVEIWEDGIVEELLVAPSGTWLPVGTVLARIRSRAAAPPPAEGPPIELPVEQLISVELGAEVRVPLPAPSGPAPPMAPPLAPVSPPVRHLARELGVDLVGVTGTGPGGGITREDVRAATEGPRRRRLSPAARALAAELGVDPATLRPSRTDGLVTVADVRAVTAVPPPPAAGEEALPVEDRAVLMRGAIARAMARSKREIPHYYLATTIDLHRALGVLEALNLELPIARRILPAAMLLRATALALRETPELNGFYRDDRFEPATDIHIGVAISLRDGGLVAPAIHDADRLSLDETMAALSDLVRRARAWRLRSSEMSDPTVTLTNLGERGVETAFPVIIPPQVAIVGFGRIVDEARAVDGMLAVRPVVHASLAADHRVSDGHRGGLFLAALDRLLQDPETLATGRTP